MRRAFLALLSRERLSWQQGHGMWSFTNRALVALLVSFLWGYATAGDWILFGLSASWLMIFLGAFWGSDAWSQEQDGERLMLFSLPCPWWVLSSAKIVAPLLLLGLCLLSALAGWSLDATGSWSASAIGLSLAHAGAVGMMVLGLAATLSARKIDMPVAFLLAFGLSASLQLGIELATWHLAAMALTFFGLHHLSVLALGEGASSRLISLD